MMPPTSIDGTDITGATIDGTDVTEITVDGDTVFEAVSIPTAGLLHDYDAVNFDGTTWTDQQGSRDLTVSSGSPQKISSGINGLPVVRFNESDGDELSETGYNIPDPYVFFAVIDVNDIGNKQGLYAGSGDDPALLLDDGSDYFVHHAFPNEIRGIAPQEFGEQVIALVTNGANSELIKDGTSLGTFDVINTTVTELTVGARSGGTFHYDGDIARLMIYDFDLMSAGQVDDVNTELISIYGL